MNNFVLNNEGNNIVAYNKLLFKNFPVALFDPPHVLHDSEYEKIPHGRGNIYNFEYNNLNLILRHYCRGGIPAKFIHDKYLWAGMENSRAMRELKMLSSMQELGLPVPNPAAVRVYKNAFTYQADIVTVLIPNSQTLGSVLNKKSLTEKNWQKIGKIIRKFHKHNCDHADLNAHNIMLDDCGKIYLIDFDRSTINVSSGKWRTRNLQRLKRSLEKLANSHENFNYQPTDFSSLMQGYGT